MIRLPKSARMKHVAPGKPQSQPPVDYERGASVCFFRVPTKAEKSTTGAEIGSPPADGRTSPWKSQCCASAHTSDVAEVPARLPVLQK